MSTYIHTCPLSSHTIPSTSTTVKIAGDFDIRQNSHDHLHVAVFVSAVTTHISTVQIISVSTNCGDEHNLFYKGCIVYKFESDIALLLFIHGLTLKEARIKASRFGFNPKLFSYFAFFLTTDKLLNRVSHIPLPQLHFPLAQPRTTFLSLKKKKKLRLCS